MFEVAAMPKKLVWTEGQDTQIRRMRSEGMHWDSIADVLGLNRWTVIERGRRIGCSRRPQHAPIVMIDADRPPLPAGSTETWGAITRGTPLDGTPFRIPAAIR